MTNNKRITVYVQLLMRSARYIGPPIWTAITCRTASNSITYLQTYFPATGRLGGEWLNSQGWAQAKCKKWMNDFVCGLINGNGRAAVQLYQERFPIRRLPNHQI
ncbi:hypothetical protein NPIL_642351 [Nephila pilipes]|uniref:Uncharacterized protein n=1 Tax=Nephila pilipes TaxID=299642 RepID=A0A8X6PSC3_NEPPI|nr:hypothetical protein NPIL_522171 [Nephila pilipes]GFU31388.1 hypothetical protein NPIL_642351 [Nephila pilipes]